MEEVTEGAVLRTGTERRGIAPFSRARIEDFLPSSEDKRIAEEAGKPVLVSVFDCARTTLAQCLAIRKLAPDAPVFRLLVGKIREAHVAGQEEPLKVIRDPLPEPLCFLPGADGHCGIQGLGRRPGVPRHVQKLLCSLLVDLSVAL